MIRVENLHRSFDGKTVLHNLSFEVAKGELVALIGQSGGGKSVLLKHMAGLKSPDSGRVLVDGRDIHAMDRAALMSLRERLGFLFQGGALFDSLTVFENVALALEVIGEHPSFIRKKTHQALKSVGLSEREGAYPLQLSGGEQQRVAIARAVVKDPLILLADEPTGNLDPDLTREIMILFRSTHIKGTTVVVATHSRELLEDTAQRTILLNRGQLVGEK